jgi:hypothetical protein
MDACVRLILLAGAITLAACSPKAAAPAPEPERPADASIIPKNPFFGKWQLTRAQIAPWWDGKGDEPVADPTLTMIDFRPGRSSGAPVLACDKPKYSVAMVTPAGLFEGNLPDPFLTARTLGFLDKDITMLSFGCASGSADVSLDFPLLNDDTIMLGLDNVIYTFTRTPE